MLLANSFARSHQLIMAHVCISTAMWPGNCPTPDSAYFTFHSHS